MLGEGRNVLRSLSSRLIADDRVFSFLQQALKASLAARQRVDRNLLRVLAALNLPTYPDVARIDEQVALLEEDVARLAGRLAVLRARLDRRSPEGRPTGPSPEGRPTGPSQADPR